MKTHFFIAFLVTGIVLLTCSSLAQTVVIVNTSVPSSTSFDVDELLDVYTLNKAHWEDGSRITVFDLKRGKSKAAFYEYIGMSEEELQRIWLRKQFTGRARPPRSLSSEEEIVERVGRTPGAIGYVQNQSVKNNRNVRVVAKIKGTK
ncbi:MAG: hypothetical protein C0600_13975 [Ignavibacteria bacterium]|nr:MAG: hypothetical protein C0600_13975 [Ignavibacteria bacterium]